MDIEFFPYYDQHHNLSAVVVNFQDITKEILQQKEAEAYIYVKKSDIE
jgi:hypothetical protein